MKLAAKSDEPPRLSQGFTDAVWVYRRKIRNVKTAVRSLEPLRKALLAEIETCESQVTPTPILERNHGVNGRSVGTGRLADSTRARCSLCFGSA
ncbi:MAG: hypothetical protein F4087_01595 [Gemmatimonadetes bacterium]|nr:hypothetical protein [Gemmatimonadota bacterium]MYE93619.1 hypothetical protein [Gemmatimonadota bacterium]MYJ67192.1 hypothetical protein [Gemmatimonadota bacterium]